jgi:type IV pilus assembly protein PilA
MRGERGFTLIEVVIVVAIIATLIAVAVPNMLRARIQANEAAAIQDLNVIAEAQISFNAARYTFGNFAVLTADTSGPPFLQSHWVEGMEKNGYRFSIPTATATHFEAYADPITVDVSGNRYFRVDTSGVIRSSTTGRPGPNDRPIGSGD